MIAEFPNHPRGVLPEAYRHRFLEDDRTNDYRVLRVWVKTGVEKNQATRLAFYASFTAAAAAVGPLAGRADVVLATSPPLFTGLAGVALARLNRAPLVLDVRDLWPAAAEALGQISGVSMISAAAALERWLYRQSDAVVAVTRPFCDHIDALRSRAPATVLIPNGTLEMFFEDAEGGSRERARRPGGRVPRHLRRARTGSRSRCRSVLDAAGRVNGKRPLRVRRRGADEAGARGRGARALARERALPSAGADRRRSRGSSPRATRCSCRSRGTRCSRASCRRSSSTSWRPGSR